MSKPITCALCGGEVDDADAVMMPNGPMCLDPCYLWIEKMMDEAEPVEDDDGEVTIYFFGEDDDDEEEDSWSSDDLI